MSGAFGPLAMAPSHIAVGVMQAFADEERDDVLAYIERRIGNAAKIAANNAADAETREFANDRRRQFEVLRDEIAAGMHVGTATIEQQRGRM